MLVRPNCVADGGLDLSAAGPAADCASTCRTAAPVPVSVWRSARRAQRPADDEARKRGSAKIIGRSARLVYLDDPTRRVRRIRTSPRPADRVSFADGYPLLLATDESLDALNAYIAAGPLADEGPLPMIRFRPSVVVQGAHGLGRGRLAAASGSAPPCSARSRAATGAC